MMVEQTERARGRFEERMQRDETQYKRAQNNITGMKVYDWASALGPVLILEKLSSTGESYAAGLKTDAEGAFNSTYKPRHTNPMSKN